MFSQFASRASVGALLLSLGAAGCTSSPAVGSRSSALGSTSLVISKVYGGGGNTGSPLTYDFVEIFNLSAATVNTGGWSLQYESATSTTANWFITPLVAVDIPAGGYYLAQLATAKATVGAALPQTPDVTSTAINLSASAGKIALANVTTALTCGAGVGSCLGAAGVVDFVGYGNAKTGGANDSEGAPAPTASTASALVRAGNGCTDTDNNFADFTLLTITQPSDVTLHSQAGSPTFVNLCTPADMTSVPDLLPPVDLIGADLTPPPDLYVPPDLIGADMTPPPDMTKIPPDMTVGPDMTIVSTDMASTAAGVGDVVISQIYAAGGNGGASYQNDYVELFNRGKATVQLGNWSVQYAPKASDFSQVTILPPGASIAPGQYFLVQAAGTLPAQGMPPVGAVLPTADYVSLNDHFNFSVSAGKLALVETPITLGCGGATRCSDPTISDLVGYGTGATDYEGSGVASAPADATSAIFRAGAGCVDTQDSKADFASAAAMPRNSATAAVDCSLVVLDMSAATGDDASVPIDLGHAGGGGTAGGGGAGGGTAAGGGGGGTHVSSGGGGGCSVAANGSSDAGAPIVLLLAAGVLWFRRRVRLG